MNPYALLAVGIAWAASCWYCIGLGQDREIARQARDTTIADRATKAATDAAAKAIAKIKVEHTTIQNEVQREIRERTVYRDCMHSPEQLQRLNAAITGQRTEPAGSGVVPRADAAARGQRRGDDGKAARGGGAVP